MSVSTERESLLKKSEECALVAQLASDPDVRKTNAKLARVYRMKAARLSRDSRRPAELKQQV
jgi:hypothetical protein